MEVVVAVVAERVGGIDYGWRCAACGGVPVEDFEKNKGEHGE